MTTYDGTVCKGQEWTQAAFDEVGLNFGPLDPNNLHMDRRDGWKSDSDLPETWTGADGLEGMEYAVAYCRALYDLNEVEGGFCCQAIHLAAAIEGNGPFFLLVESDKTETIDTEITIMDGEVSWSAEVFGSAATVGASFMALATSAIMFTY